MESYRRANSRADLSLALIHLTRDAWWTGGPTAFDVLHNIVATRTVNASMQEHITRYDPLGAACFYDVPYQNWDDLIRTNPNGRRGYGVAVMKSDFWRVGGRPVIYTDKPDSEQWPMDERYRLVRTELDRFPHPWDWMHEREWRMRGALQLSLPWWPCVPTLSEAYVLMNAFSCLQQVYLLETRSVHVRLATAG